MLGRSPIGVGREQEIREHCDDGRSGSPGFECYWLDIFSYKEASTCSSRRRFADSARGGIYALLKYGIGIEDLA
jgi:hypothetical protein